MILLFRFGNVIQIIAHEWGRKQGDWWNYFDEVRKRILHEMKRRIDDMEEADFDVISGLSGIAHYCFLKEDMYHEILQEIIKIIY